MSVFDHSTAPLEKATSIEASAGTGKTYTLEHLVLRYITETGFDINAILVVTFTEKATQEMQDRVRLLIQKQLNATLKEGNDVHHQRLTQAMKDFNQASIYTIHGFCRRVLQEFNFYSNLPFDMSHIENNYFAEECLWDLFREEKISPLEYRVLQRAFNLNNQKQTIDFVLDLYWNKINNPRFSLTKPLAMDSINMETCLNRLKKMICGETTLSKTVKKTQEYLNNLNESELAKDISLLNKNSYKVDKVSLYYHGLKTLNTFFDTSTRSSEKYSDYFNLFDWLGDNAEWKKFATSKLKLLKKHSLKDLRHISLYDHLQAILQAYKKEKKELFEIGFGLIDKCLRLLEEQINFYRAESGQQTFEDQILDLEKALKEYPILATALSQKYRAVLIDEFQDTDPCQWSIFKVAFLSKGVPVFLIGDPKQSIYQFRGANLNTYLKAVQDEHILNRGFLMNNYRSNPLLIRAFNILFQKLFDDTETAYVETHFPKNKTPSSIQSNQPALSHSPAPFELYFLNENLKNDKKISLPEIRQKNIDFIIAEIKVLQKNMKEKTDSTPSVNSPMPTHITLKDIAILTSSNSETQIIKEALNQEGIPSVTSNQGNVWSSIEASEISILLKAIRNPTSTAQVMGIFFTSFFRLDNRQIKVIREKYLLFFQELLLNWKIYIEAKKIIKVKRELFHYSFKRDDIYLSSYLKNQLSVIGGERSVTNVEHLFELLNEFQIKNEASLTEMIAEVERQMQNVAESDDNLIRLDMEKEAVQILTMHKSKGLEFSVVFLHGGLSRETNRNQLSYFSYFAGDRKVFDFNKILEEESKEGEKREDSYKKNELYRLFYVAITRAKEKVYLPLCEASGIRNPRSMPLMIFWHKVLGGEYPEKSTLFQYLPKNEDIFRLRPLCLDSSSLISPSEKLKSSPLPLSSQKLLPPKPPTWNRYVNNYPGMTSFSQLEKNLPEYEYAIEGSVKQELSHEEVESSETTTVFNFAKGPHLGNLIHKILETIPFEAVATLFSFNDFCQSAEISSLISEQTRSFFDARWEKQYHRFVKQIIWQTLKTPISHPDGETFNLSQLSSKNRTHEVEFLFTVKKCQLNFPYFKEKLPPIDKDGYLKGFIDFVFKWKDKFYLADWKTNALGPSIANYQKEYLEEAMEKHHYKWQSLIYTIALCRQIASGFRDEPFDYEKYIGGIYYFFVRGMSPEDESRDAGVYFHRFDAQHLSRLSRSLLNTSEFRFLKVD